MAPDEEEIIEGLRGSMPRPSAELRSRVLVAAFGNEQSEPRATARMRFAFRAWGGGVRYAVCVAGMLAIYGAVIGALDAQRSSLLAGSPPGSSTMLRPTPVASSILTLQALEARSRTLTDLLSPALDDEHRSDHHGAI